MPKENQQCLLRFIKFQESCGIWGFRGFYRKLPRLSQETSEVSTGHFRGFNGKIPRLSQETSEASTGNFRGYRRKLTRLRKETSEAITGNFRDYCRKLPRFQQETSEDIAGNFKGFNRKLPRLQQEISELSHRMLSSFLYILCNLSNFLFFRVEMEGKSQKFFLKFQSISQLSYLFSCSSSQEAGVCIVNSFSAGDILKLKTLLAEIRNYQLISYISPNFLRC